MLRLFIAVDLPGEIQSDVEALMGHVHNARWVNPRQLHITLRFLGDTAEATLPALRDGLARVRQGRFSLQLRGVGVFPPGHPRKPPRVLWLGIEPAGDLVSLKSAIDAALAGSPAAMAEPGFARRSPNAGSHGNPPRVSISAAMAEPGFARRSPNAGSHGNPPRVSISTSPGPFSPHLTLARFRRPPDRTLADFLEKYQDHKSPVWPVANFCLYQSTLRREGAIHALVESYPLG
jgi:2'-5' RNA ligase